MLFGKPDLQEYEPMLSAVKVLAILKDLKSEPLDQEAQAIIDQYDANAADLSNVYQQAFIALYEHYEQGMQKAAVATFGLNAFQAKKILYKKDRVRLFRKFQIDFNAIEYAESIHTLGLIFNSLEYEGHVTEALAEAMAETMPEWEVGAPLTNLDQVYKELAPQCVSHYSAMLDALSAAVN